MDGIRQMQNVLTDDIDVDPITGFPADRALLARIVKKKRE